MFPGTYRRHDKYVGSVKEDGIIIVDRSVKVSDVNVRNSQPSILDTAKRCRESHGCEYRGTGDHKQDNRACFSGVAGEGGAKPCAQRHRGP